MGVIKGDTRSLDNGSYRDSQSEFEILKLKTQGSAIRAC